MKETKSTSTKRESLLLDAETKTLAHSLRKKVNNKEIGSNVPMKKIVLYALSKLTEEDVKVLQRNSYSNADIKKLYWKRYQEKVGAITADEFDGFTMSNEFQKFKKENKDIEMIA